MIQGMSRDLTDKETSEKRHSPRPHFTDQIWSQGPKIVNQGLLCPDKSAIKGALQWAVLRYGVQEICLLFDFCFTLSNFLRHQVEALLNIEDRALSVL